MTFCRLSSVLVTLLFILLFTMMGCNPCINGYKQVTADNGITRFSFEYPCNWEFGVIKGQLGGNDKFFVEAPPLQREDKLRILSTYWAFRVNRASIVLGPRNARAALEDEISNWDEISRLLYESEFKVLERTEVEISGVPAEKVVSTRKYRPIAKGSKFWPTEELEYMTHRWIFFDYDGFIWWIEEQSNIEVAEAHKVHFEHMLQTFRILN